MIRKRLIEHIQYSLGHTMCLGSFLNCGSPLTRMSEVMSPSQQLLIGSFNVPASSREQFALPR
jgi:hypothetical protein